MLMRRGRIPWENCSKVAVVLKEKDGLTELEKKLEEIERTTDKRQIKWRRVARKVRERYLEELVQIKELKNSIFYSVYHDSKEYSRLTSLTIAKAVLAKKAGNYTVTVIIDGLNARERDTVREELKKLKIKYRKIRGMKDEQNVFLRLADSMAGFLREVLEDKSYTKRFIRRFRTNGIISET